MKSADLLEEAEAYAGAMRGHLAQLGKLGLLPGIAQLGEIQPPVGLAKVQRSRGETWEPGPVGAHAMVIPVCRDIIVEPFEGIKVDTIECVDIVAFKSQATERWAWRTGLAWALGEQIIEQEEEPLQLVSTPLAWLRYGGEAACILDWSDSSPAWPYLRNAHRVIVEDPLLQRRIATRLRETARLPVLEVEHAA